MLVTASRQKKVASLQVKFSKDYNATQELSEPKIVSIGWWTLTRKQIAASSADLWVFVLYQFYARRFDFVVIPPADLLKRFDDLGVRTDIIHTYFSVTNEGRCWQTRGLGKADLARICANTYENPHRDFTSHLNQWSFPAVRRGQA